MTTNIVGLKGWANYINSRTKSVYQPLNEAVALQNLSMGTISKLLRNLNVVRNKKSGYKYLVTA